MASAGTDGTGVGVHDLKLRISRFIILAVTLATIILILSSGCITGDPEWVFVPDEFRAPIGRRLDDIRTSMPLQIDDSTTLTLRAKVFVLRRANDQFRLLRVILSYQLAEGVSHRKIRIFSDRARLFVNNDRLKFDPDCSIKPGSKLKQWQDLVWAAYDAPLDSLALVADSTGKFNFTVDLDLDSVIYDNILPIPFGGLQVYALKIRTE
jgi:hypothetical protein